MIRQALARLRPRVDAARLAQRAGDLLRRRQDAVRVVQWAFVAVYLTLLLLPVLLPLTPVAPAVAARVARFAEIVFWGVWWPGVLLSVLLVGQFWCGVLCPDGTLTEFASRRGRGGKIPAWLRRAGWPLFGFSLLFTWEHLVDAYGRPTLVLLAVGGMTLLALGSGLLFGRGKRVWCRYACPAGGVFSLLSRCAVLHFKVDRAAWDAAPRPQPAPVDCPLLLDVRRLRSNEKCSMCGRCSGHRDAVALAPRAPGGEIATLAAADARGLDAFAVCFVLCGLAYGVINAPGGRLHAWLSALAPALPDWVPTLAAMLLVAAAVGSLLAALLLAAGGGARRRAQHLSYALIPLAGIGLFLGALDYAFMLLAEAGQAVAGARAAVRGVAIAVGAAWSLSVGRALCRRSGTGGVFLAAAILGFAAVLLAAEGHIG
ncbi:MAG: 4Fe-4S binding protein [Rhodocyclaceae bacterium]|nr:4Fe-4S binding protein [Rhodocyclaceae bacterium]